MLSGMWLGRLKIMCRNTLLEKSLCSRIVSGCITRQTWISRSIRCISSFETGSPVILAKKNADESVSSLHSKSTAETGQTLNKWSNCNDSRKIIARRNKLYGFIQGHRRLHPDGKKSDLVDMVNRECNSMMKELQLDMHLYNVMLRAHILINNQDGILDCLRMIEEDPHVEADVNTFNLLIEYYRCHGKLDQCHVLMQRMRDAKVSPDQITISTMLAAYVDHVKALTSNKSVDSRSLRTRSEELFGTFLRMSSSTRSSTPSQQRNFLSVVTSMLRIRLHCGQMEKAFELLDLLKTRRIEASVVIYKVLLKELLDRHQIDQAWRVWIDHIYPDSSSSLDDHMEIFYQFLYHGRGRSVLQSIRTKWSQCPASAVNALLRFEGFGLRNEQIAVNVLEECLPFCNIKDLKVYLKDWINEASQLNWSLFQRAISELGI